MRSQSNQTGHCCAGTLWGHKRSAFFGHLLRLRADHRSTLCPKPNILTSNGHYEQCCSSPLLSFSSAHIRTQSRLRKGAPPTASVLPSPHSPSLRPQPPSAPHALCRGSQTVLKRVVDESKNKTTKEDWDDWLKKFGVELLQQSGHLPLRYCSALANQYQPLARELFNIAFVSAWNEMSEKTKVCGCGCWYGTVWGAGTCLELRPGGRGRLRPGPPSSLSWAPPPFSPPPSVSHCRADVHVPALVGCLLRLPGPTAAPREMRRHMRCDPLFSGSR